MREEERREEGMGGEGNHELKFHLRLSAWHTEMNECVFGVVF